MRGLILTLATVLPLSVSTLPAGAAPLVISTDAGPAPAVILVEGGCGIGFHRGPFGGCRPNGYGYGYGGYGGGYVIPGRRYCPPGYHLGPYGRVCNPN